MIRQVAGIRAVVVNHAEVDQEWWSEGVETDINLEGRLMEVVDQIEHDDADSIVIVAHRWLPY